MVLGPVDLAVPAGLAVPEALAIRATGTAGVGPAAQVVTIPAVPVVMIPGGLVATAVMAQEDPAALVSRVGPGDRVDQLDLASRADTSPVVQARMAVRALMPQVLRGRAVRAPNRDRTRVDLKPTVPGRARPDPMRVVQRPMREARGPMQAHRYRTPAGAGRTPPGRRQVPTARAEATCRVARPRPADRTLRRVAIPRAAATAADPKPLSTQVTVLATVRSLPRRGRACAAG